MDNKEEIEIEIREDVLKFLTAKAERYGYTIDELIENYLKTVVRLKGLPLDDDELKELIEGEIPPIISAEDLTSNIDEGLDTLIKSDDVMLIWRNGEVEAVLMMKQKYDGLALAAKAATKGVENES